MRNVPHMLLRMGIACLYTAAAAAQSVSHAPAVTTTAHELMNETETATVTIVQIDHQSRLVTLRTEDGQEDTIKVGTAVKNLDQIKPGDVATMTYQHALALELLPANSAATGAEVAGDISRNENKGAPGGTVERSVTLTTKLSGVDLEKHTVTLTGADGKTRTIEVKDPARQAQLSKLKVGDLVRITYVEALAIAINPKSKVNPKLSGTKWVSIS